ncbi:MAG: type VI secretion system-associated protein TagF [Pseudomonadota bacterium]
MTQPLRPSFGAFGKIPGLGDFVRIGVPQGFTDPWDTWLSHSIAQFRGHDEEMWEKLYMFAPIWRFSLAAGLAGPNVVSGIMMPSVDAVGRRFPLTCVAAVPAQTPVSAHIACGEIFPQLEQLSLSMLDDGMDRATLETGLGAISLPDRITAAIGADISAIWSAIIGSSHRIMTTAGLPSGTELKALFDPDDAYWNT